MSLFKWFRSKFSSTGGSRARDSDTRVEDSDTIRCPACDRAIGSRWAARQSLGPFGPTTSVGGFTKCPHCGREFYVRL